MSYGSSSLSGIIDRDTLQQLQDNISRETNISAVILDSSGFPVTKMTNARGLCGLIEDSRLPDGICRATHKEICRMACETRKPATMICPLSGTTGASIPIFLDDTFLGAWVIGQIRFLDDPLEAFEEAAYKSGINYATAQKLLKDIPVFSRSGFKAIVNFMSIVTGELVALTASNTEVNKKNRQLIELTESFGHSMAALRAFADTPDVCIYVTDFYTREILMCNNTYASYLGKTSDELVGTHCFENLGYSSRCPFCPEDKLIDENENPLPPYNWENHLENFGVYMQVTNRAVRWVDGRLVNMSVSTDITRRKKMEDELYNLAFYDQVLQIPNYERMEQDMKDGCRYEYLVAVRLSDIRRINNIFGRAYVDALLKDIRDYILDMNIPDSTLYRGKISDFGILFKGKGENDELPRRIAEKIHNRCKKAWEVSIDNQPQNVFTAASVCALPMEGHHEHFLGFLYSAVEHSLDMSHKTGRVIIYDDDTRERHHKGIKLEHSLKSAVHENMRGFHVVYQPIVNVALAMWTGLEALCRWDSPEFGSVPPDVFIPLAEASGLIGDIGLWVLEQAVIQTKALGLDAVEKFLLEVNLSPIQLAIPNLDEIIMALLKKHNYPPKKLGLEITESSELNFSKHTIEAVVQLSRLGVVIVLDDFGTGYSSFNMLHKLPADILKTDRAFITGLESDGHLQKLICVMVGLAHGSNMKFVAEGVESDSQVQFLLNQGADFFQGYFFSRPLTAEQLAEQLDNFYYPIEHLSPCEGESPSAPQLPV